VNRTGTTQRGVLLTINHKMPMKKVLLFLLLISFITEEQLVAQDWTLEKNKEEIQVFTRKVDGYAIKEYKAITTLTTTIADLVELMKNHENLKSWFVKCPISKRLKKVSDNDYYVYFLNDAPWPVSDRDNVTKMTFERLENGTQLIYLKGVPDYIPEKSGIVRLPRMQAKWIFEPQPNGQVKVTQQVLADLGGKVPGWLVNFAIVEAPFETLSNLRKRIESKE